MLQTSRTTEICSGMTESLLGLPFLLARDIDQINLMQRLEIASIQYQKAPIIATRSTTCPTIMQLIQGCPTTNNFDQCIDQINIILISSEMQAERASENQISEPYTAESLAQRLELEGQCRIETFSFLQFSWAKSIFLFFLLLLSVVGLLLLKYYKSLRAAVFYKANPMYDAATHIYIRANGKRQEEIVKLERRGKDIFFFYKKLKYQYFEGKCYPVGIDFQTYLREHLTEQYMKQGLTSQAVEKNVALYDKNEHIVDPPTYLEYLYEVMTEPFFFVQYMAAVIYIIEKMPELSVLLIGASIITTSINYIILYISYRKIKEIAEVVVTVSVLRNGSFLDLPSNQLVPGDIFIPNEEISCDVILLKGEVYVNEANLTGESIPIGKFGIDQYKNYRPNNNSMWIYEGSKLLSASNPLAMVVHTGYSSKKGRILRKILHRNPEYPHFFTTFIVFMFEVYAAGVIAYLGTMSLRVNTGQLEPIIIFLDFLLIITFCFPPSGPIYFNLVYSFSLIRLKANNILGTEPEKTVESAHLSIMCFDKTGTLTQDKVEVRRVIKFGERGFQEIRLQSHRQSLDFKLFSCCHTVKEFDGKLMGDEIDLKMFLHSGYRLCPSKEAATCFQVEQLQRASANRLQVLKIYQYQSKFQSMSVLAYDVQTKKHYVFAKGAPEIIHKYSTNKFAYFDKLLQTQSYGGFRTIGYGYKEVDHRRISEHLHASREEHLSQIKMLGLIAFENKLKHDARETIHRLELAGIQSKMITGDNVYIAIETAVRCGILERKDEVIVIEGRNTEMNRQWTTADIKFYAKIFRFEKEDVIVKNAMLSYEEYHTSARPIIVDNDFLKLRQDIKLSPMIKVYSRISPQNKALIVRKLREGIASNHQQLKWWDKVCSNEEEKVGMVGDGANDLLAIKEANIGIGIRNCDSSYAASFSIQNLIDIDYIVREAKCSEREIIQICRFMCIGGLLTVPCIIIMETEAAFYSTFQLIFDNFTKYLVFPILLALSRPAAEQTPHKPSSNFLKKQNQLVFWGNVVISTLAIGATVIYYRSTSEYVYNYTKATVDSGWASNNSLVASSFLYYSLQPVILVFCVYQGAPWKEPLYCNVLLLIVVLLNLIFQIGCYFFQSLFASFFVLPTISSTAALYLFIIGAAASILVLLWSRIIGALNLHEQSQNCLKSKQMVELAQTGSSDN